MIMNATKVLKDPICAPRFVPRQRETAHVHIMKGSGCSSSIGRTGGRQTVSLGSGCVYAGAGGDEVVIVIVWERESNI